MMPMMRVRPRKKKTLDWALLLLSGLFPQQLILTLIIVYEPINLGWMVLQKEVVGNTPMVGAVIKYFSKPNEMTQIP